MQTRKFDELISYFNRKVADMSIDTKYKMELLGMVSALGFAHERELTAQTEQHWTPVTEELPEQRIGHWHITDAYPHNVYCSECHKRFAQTHWAVWEDGSLPRNFCPNCGAKMEGDAE